MFPSDLDLLFTDWSIALTYRQVTAVYNPATLEIDEIHTEAELRALINHAPSPPTPAAAGRLPRPDLSLLVRTADLPAGAPALTDRIVWQSHAYQLTAWSASPDAGTHHLEARRLE